MLNEYVDNPVKVRELKAAPSSDEEAVGLSGWSTNACRQERS